MIFAEIKEQLQPHLAVELERLYAVFEIREQNTDLQTFLRYLHHHQVISDRLFDRIQEQAVELTSLQDLAPVDAGDTLDGTVLAGDAEVPQTVSSQWHEKETYAMLRLLGKGAMGLVYLAKDVTLQRKVAYKQLLSEMIGQSRLVLSRFLNEAQITAQLDHPNVVPIYSLDRREDGSLAYAMKVVRGKTFKELIQETQYFHHHHQPIDEDHSLTTLLTYFLSVCDAMAFAHNKKVIHRDLKPANIMVGEYNEVYVMDWGIARLFGRGTHEIPHDELVEVAALDSDEPPEERTQVGQIVGTPRYMSPQQGAGKNDELDGRSDLFSLGLILYELVALKPAFTAKTQMELLKKVLKAQKEPLVHFNPKVKIPWELAAIIDKATTLKTADRYATVANMADDLRRFLRGDAILAKPDTPLQKVLRWMAKHRQATLLMVMILLLACSSAIIGSLYSRQQAQLAAQQREKKFGSFLTAVSQQSQLVNIKLFKTRALLQGLAAASRQALTHGAIDPNEVYYTDHPFQPPGMVHAPHYNGKISLEWANFTIGIETTEAKVKHRLKQMNPLRHYLRRMLINSRTEGQAVDDPKAIYRMIGVEGVPLMFASVVMPESLIQFFPGVGYNTPGYTPLTRPFYKLVLGKYGVLCGNPYVDRLLGAFLPCSLAIYDAQAKFIGVATFDMQFNYLIDHFMSIKNQPAIIRSYLVDQQGRIIVRSTDRQKNIKDTNKIDSKGLQLPLFPYPKMQNLIKTQDPSGYFETPDPKTHQPRMVAYDRLTSLGWYFVVEADSQVLLNTRVDSKPDVAEQNEGSQS